ncbi:acetolactate synthase 2 catalytic subunit [Thalassotalea sp. PS06]|uniref:acetolactate synthase 2 catalytic subunit n=1 Tax=Thalassotalea sp. PS06 TaxID=2594005 RepID=UPI001165834B|nr:acetolactate synthase 2 catalytic subunit [Thalassotalea sp. PS06]QDP02683.1 acetolactate synthase 2 catalytic subunit [Thalassotalea sp. PS06]
MTGAELLLKALQQHGVDSLFGYPGGAIMPVYDALYDSPIKHFLCRHEQGAGFSALGYSRASNKLGVCLATSGPGATNLITAIADAFSDSIPMLAITGQVAKKAMGSDAFQEVDILGLSLACTKYCEQVQCASEIPVAVSKAVEIAYEGRPGPVLIDIPKDVQIQKLDSERAERLLAELASKPQTVAPLNPVISLPNQQKLQTLIEESRSPIFYVGGGVGMADAVEHLRDLMAAVNIPSVTTLKGIGAIDPEAEYFLGMLGMHGSKPANLAVQECDLLIALGARFDDRVTGKLAEFAPKAKVIQLDIDNCEVNKRRGVDLPIVADLKQSLPVFKQLLIGLRPHLQIDAWQQRCQQLSTDFPWRYDHPGEGIYAPSVLSELGKMLSKDAVTTTDVGQHQMWAAQHMMMHDPKNFLSSGGLGTMGFGLPAAIGAQVARPNDTVVAVCGDGSLMMNIQELSTLKRYQIPVKILLIDNAKLGMVRQWQELFFQERYSETDLSDNPDFVSLATAFDIKAKLITTKQQVSAALTEMLAHQGPYLLQVRIDEMDNVWPLVPPETANHGMLEAGNGN